MQKKGAIELSLNFIVIIVITIIIFGFGIRFIYMLASKATELQDMTTSELDARIGNLICEGSERVCIGIDRKIIPRTKFDVFGIKIINILESQDFVVNVNPPNPPNPIGYRKDNTAIPGTNGLIVNPQQRAVRIERNDDKTVGVGIQVPANAVSGTYIFNVEIKQQNDQTYVPIQKLYVDVP